MKNHGFDGFIVPHADRSVKLAYDPWLHTLNDLALFKDVELVPCETNPIDTIWLDQPE